MSLLQLRNRFNRSALEKIKWNRAACTGNIFIQSHLHDLVRQLMTLLLGRKDKHSVALVLESLVLGNTNKTLFQEFIVRVPRNFEH